MTTSSLRPAQSCTDQPQDPCLAWKHCFWNLNQPLFWACLFMFYCMMHGQIVIFFSQRFFVVKAVWKQLWKLDRLQNISVVRTCFLLDFCLWVVIERGPQDKSCCLNVVFWSLFSIQSFVWTLNKVSSVRAWRGANTSQTWHDVWRESGEKSFWMGFLTWHQVLE